MKHLYPNVAELHAFAASAKYLNFSYAARELGLTPSAVSRQIANLEALFGVKLFVREGRLGFDWDDELLAKTRWQA